MRFLGTIKMCLGKCNSVQALNQETFLFSQAQLKAAEEERQKEEEEQKRRAAERRREEKRQEREVMQCLQENCPGDNFHFIFEIKSVSSLRVYI